jgi:hypothetical protein
MLMTPWNGLLIGLDLASLGCVPSHSNHGPAHITPRG